MILTFTGTRNGMTPAQYERVFFVAKNANWKRGAHGCAKGADREFHEITRTWPHDLFPSREDQHQWALQAAVGGKDVIYPIPTVLQPELFRNRQMVELGNALVAAPGGMQEVLRSGTWATIRYARQMKKYIVICFPDGTIREENK